MLNVSPHTTKWWGRVPARCATWLLRVLGAGGIYAEVTNDFAFRLAPVSKLAATQMLDELRCAPILRGVRGEPRCFLDGVVDVLLRVSMLVHRYPQIRELDINPLIVNENEVIAVDARVFLG